MSQQISKSKPRTFWEESKKIIPLTIPLETANQRMKSILAGPLNLSANSLEAATTHCVGYLSGNTIRMEYSRFGRGQTQYDIWGQISQITDHKSEIELIISRKSSPKRLIFAALLFFLIPILISLFSGISGFTTWLTILLIGCLAAIVGASFVMVADIFDRKSVLKNICRFLRKNIQAG